MAYDVFAILVRLSVVGTAGILFVAVLRVPLRRAMGAEVAYWLWLLLPATLVAVFLPRAPSCLCGPESHVSPLVLRGIAAPLEFAPHAKVSHYPLTLTAIWGIGAAAAIAYFAWRQRALRRSLGLLQRRSDGAYWSPTAMQPMLVGAWRPKIVVPRDFDSHYSDGERAIILAHERAHLHRHDALTNAIALALVCLFWFNPIGYWAWSRFRFDQEMACDAAVLRRAKVSRRRYARTLVKTGLTTWMAVTFGWHRRHPLLERVAMLGHRVPGRTQRVLGHALALALMLSGTYVAWAARPEQTRLLGSAHTWMQGTPHAMRGIGAQQVEPNRIAGPQLYMTVPPKVPFRFQADSVSIPRHGSWMLQGHVRITAAASHVVRAGLDVITTGARPVIASAEKAVLTRRRDGGLEVRLENGSVEGL